MKKAKFASKVGLVAATVGSAVGLGNVWRFPAEVHDNGGAAFLLIYIVFIFVLGIPVMTSEFALGRGASTDAVSAFGKVSPKHRAWGLVGLWATLASYLILSFYMVVSGWTLQYLVGSVSGSLYNGSDFATQMQQCVGGGMSSLWPTYIMITLNLCVLVAGVTKGIEKMSNVAMPLLFALLLVFCGVSLALPGASEGIKFFLSPDLSKVTASTCINAIGQAFFSLSLGMGILITYASYYPKNTRLTRTAVTVSMLDLLVALLMGLIIFPGVMTFGLGGEQLQGATLVFVTLPEIFHAMGATRLWSSLFFLLLTVAAFTSTISLAEVSVAMLQDRFRMKRSIACIVVVMPLFVLSSLCALSLSPSSVLTIGGSSLFDFLDTWATNLMLPVGAILLCIYMGWVAPKKFFIGQLTNSGRVDRHWAAVNRFLVRYVAPILIALVLVAGLTK